jgi:hypothetical protein
MNDSNGERVRERVGERKDREVGAREEERGQKKE